MTTTMQSPPPNSVLITVDGHEAVVPPSAYSMLRDTLASAKIATRNSIDEKEKKLRDIFDEHYCKKCEAAWNDPDV